MTKYELFQLLWKGYQQNHTIAAGYVWDDLSNMSYTEMTEFFDRLSNRYRLEHRYNDDNMIVIPVII